MNTLEGALPCCPSPAAETAPRCSRRCLDTKVRVTCGQSPARLSRRLPAHSPKMAAACREYFSALTSAMSSWTSGRSCTQRSTFQSQKASNSPPAAPGTNLEAVVEVLGFGLDLLGVFQHSFIQQQSLAPLLHQHVRLGDEETSEHRAGQP